MDRGGRPDGPERRRAPRHALRLRVESAAFRGVTRSVSTQGLYLEASAPLAAGSEACFTLFVPGTPGSPAAAIRCVGRVLQCDRLAPGLWGLALSIAGLEFDPGTALGGGLCRRI